MTNFTLRFMYELFFEIFLCVLIHIAVAYNQSESLLVLALIILVAAISLIIFLISLFFCLGPYVAPKVYMSGSIGRSWWGCRPLISDPELDRILLAERLERERQDQLALERTEKASTKKDGTSASSSE